MARVFRGYLRFLWPPRPWRSIAEASCRTDCVDCVEAWIRENPLVLRDECFEWVILEKTEGRPDGREE